MKLVFFTSVDVYIKLFKNVIEITRLDTGESIKEKAIKNFSNNKLVFAEFENGEVSIKNVLNTLFKNEFKFPPTLNTIIQVIELNEEELSSVEERALIDSCNHANSKDTIVIKHNRPISNSQALDMLKSKKRVK